MATKTTATATTPAPSKTPAPSMTPGQSPTPAAAADWLDRWFGDLPRLWPEWRHLLGAGTEVLRVEEFTEGDTMVVRAELPGIDPDRDVEIQMSDHTLRIRAERRMETTDDAPAGYRSEFRYGSYLRSVPLPIGATADAVHATYTDGILEVRVPIDHATTEARRIPVSRG
jgi:HSP20 family protein